MFSEMPKLFDREFALGYFLPLATFLTASYLLVSAYGLYRAPPTVPSDLLVGTTLIGLLSWLGGVLLLVANWSIVRWLEGYGKLNPLRLLICIQRWRYDRLHRKISLLEDEIRTCPSREIPVKLRNIRRELMLEAANRFPDRRDLVLPTSFGNIVRSFEVYPRVMYGLDAIEGWDRLLCLIPKDYRVLVDTAKAKLDFWINLGFLSMIMVAEHACVSLYAGRIEIAYLPIAFLGVSVICSIRAKDTALEWGTTVKAAFDLFLPELLTKLQFNPPASMEEEREMWKKFSQAILYRLPDSLPERKRPAECEDRISGPSARDSLEREREDSE